MDLIDRQAAIDVLGVGKEVLSRVLDDTDVVWREREKYLWGLGLIEAYINDMKELPSAQPPYNLDEWCHDCKEYDQERHCCPRWNRVIRKTVDELELNRQKGGKNDQYTGSKLAEGLRAKPG